MGMRSGEWGVEIVDWGMGNGEWGMGSGDCGVRKAITAADGARVGEENGDWGVPQLALKSPLTP